MQLEQQPWQPLSAQSWADHVGLVNVPLFSPQSCHTEEGAAGTAVLLDGAASSFCFHVVEVTDELFDPRPLSWSWSANLRHTLVGDRSSDTLLLRRWHWPLERFERLPLPRRPLDAVELVNRLGAAKAPSAEDVVSYSLRAFRQVRALMQPENDGLGAILAFNLLLRLVDLVRTHRVPERDARLCTTLADVIRLVAEATSEPHEPEGLTASARRSQLGVVVAALLDPEPMTDFQLSPALLVRHAAGELYQEAHLILERDAQLAFPGLGSTRPPHGVPPRPDVRFTPPELARFLAQRALDDLSEGGLPAEIVALDPACGSGVFLQEALRELSAQGYRGRLSLKGYDISPIARAISEFCLAWSRRDVGDTMAVEIDVQLANALRVDWPEADVVLMNPPFVSWQKMDRHERQATKDVLGELAFGRADMAMPFLWKAVRSARESATIAAVLPAPLLETKAGARWREAIAASGALHLIGRFQGYSYFRDSAVEPSFVILAKGRPADDTDMIVARERAEGGALRALRLAANRPGHISESGAGWEFVRVPADAVTPVSWLPRSLAYMDILHRLSTSGMPRVGDLFRVRQGIRAAAKEVFVLDASELAALPCRERRFFRPIADNSTIAAGRIQHTAFIFYPYSTHGPLWTTEQELEAAVPEYFRAYLTRNREALLARSRVGPDGWWLLARTIHESSGQVWLTRV